MPAGQPTKYTSEYCVRVIALGREGKSIVQMASALDVHKDTLYEWAKVHTEFSDALTRAKQESQVWWEDVGQHALFAEKFQAGLWAKQMASRFPSDYTDRSKSEITGAEGGPVQSHLTVEFIKPDTA